VIRRRALPLGAALRGGNASVIHKRTFATWNVGTLGKSRESKSTEQLGNPIKGVADFMDEYSIDCLAIQEHRLVESDRARAHKEWKHRGFLAHWGQEDWTKDRFVPVRGVAILTRNATLSVVPYVVQPPHPKRTVAILCHRHGARPLLVVSVYAHGGSNTDRARSLFIAQTFEWAIKTGEDFLLLGDWNESEHGPNMLPFLASGVIISADAVDRNSVLPTSKHRDASAGMYGGGQCRTIDYGIVKGDLTIHSRRQLAEPISGQCHEAVVYGIGLGAPPTRCSWGKRKLLVHRFSDEKEDRWDHKWSRSKAVFDRAVAKRDATGAWDILSDVLEYVSLEDTEGVERGLQNPKRRSRFAKPKWHAAQKKDTEHPMNLRRRRLRRVLRKVSHAQRNAPSRIPSIRESARDVLRWWPPLADLDWGESQILSELRRIEEWEHYKEVQARWHRWQTSMDVCENDLIRWIKKPDELESSVIDLPITPQHGAATVFKELAALVDPEDFDNSAVRNAARAQVARRLAAHVPRPDRCPEVELYGGQLRALVRATSGKAGGVDQWVADFWLDLPDCAYDAIAMVWNLVLQGAELPPVWTKVRVVTLPKETGGYRGLGIAVLVWRIGMSAIVSALSGWSESWLPAELVGGIKGRSADELHERVMSDIDQANERLLCLVGSKIDLKKCFDTVVPSQAIVLWEEWGAPRGVLSVLRRFYAAHERWVEFRGAVHPDCIKPVRALLQGCPASALLLNAIMTVWVYHVKSKVPDVNLGAFLDDRTFWLVGDGPAITTLLHKAMGAGKYVDHCFGMEEHPAKRGIFTNHKSARAGLASLDTAGTGVTTNFELLGIYHECGPVPRPFVNTKAWAEGFRRLERIKYACHGVFKRQKMIRMLVLPKMLWGSAWQETPPKDLSRLRLAIERSIRRKPGLCIGSRSKLLMWGGSLGPGSCPYFYAANRALGCERRRQTRIVRGSPVIKLLAKGHPLKRVLRDWQWIQRSETSYETADGPIDLILDSVSAVDSIAKRAWRDWMWKSESRVQRSPDYEMQWFGREPMLDEHVKWNAKHPLVNGVRNERVGWMYARHGKWAGLEHTRCRCGQARPDRAHWAWECTFTNDERNLALRPVPVGEGERRLCVPLVQRVDRGWQPRNWDPVPGLLNYVLSHLAASGNVVIATDGGACGAQWRDRVAAFGVAVGDFTYSEQLYGVDNSAYAAELWALYKVCVTIAGVPDPIIIIIDNMAVVRGAKALLTDCLTACDNCPGLWQKLATLFKRLPKLTVEWVPSHGKSPWWTAPKPTDTESWRLLNDAADVVLAKPRDLAWARDEPRRLARDASARRAKAALQRCWKGAEAFREDYPEMWGDDGCGGGGDDMDAPHMQQRIRALGDPILIVDTDSEAEILASVIEVTDSEDDQLSSEHIDTDTESGLVLDSGPVPDIMSSIIPCTKEKTPVVFPVADLEPSSSATVPKKLGVEAQRLPVKRPRFGRFARTSSSAAVARKFGVEVQRLPFKKPRCGKFVRAGVDSVISTITSTGSVHNTGGLKRPLELHKTCNVKSHDTVCGGVESGVETLGDVTSAHVLKRRRLVHIGGGGTHRGGRQRTEPVAEARLGA
jgi:hypothetical protein